MKKTVLVLITFALVIAVAGSGFLAICVVRTTRSALNARCVLRALPISGTRAHACPVQGDVHQEEAALDARQPPRCGDRDGRALRVRKRF